MLLYSIAGFVFLIPPCVAFLPVAFNNTVIHAILRFYLPESWMKNRIIGTISCSTYIAVVATLGVIQPAHFLVSTIVVIAESQSFLETSYIGGNVYERSISNVFSKRVQKLNLTRAYKAYQVTALVWRELLWFGYVFFPTLMFSGYVVNVVCTFSLIKLHSEIPSTLVLMLGLLDVATAGITVAIHKYDLKIIEKSSKFFYYWENEHMSSLGRRCIKACMPIKVNCGQFFNLEPTTLLNTFMQVADMTATMLLV